MKRRPVIQSCVLVAAGLLCSTGQADAQTKYPTKELLSKHGLERLEPKWVGTWRGKAQGGANNAWDVHVYRNRVYAVGIKTDRVLGKIAPLVFNAYTLDGKSVWQKTWKGYRGKFGTGAAGTIVLGHGDYLYVGGAVAKDDMNASLLQKWDLKGNLIWTEYWGDKTDGGHHEVNGLAIVDHYIYVSHYSAASGLITIDANIKKFDLKKLDARRPKSESLVWSKAYGKADSHNTTDGHIYADETGVYICGQYGGTKGRNPYNEGDAYLAKFDPNGKQLWMKLYKGNGTGTDNAFSLKSDGKHIFLTGPTMTMMRRKIGSIPLGLEIQVFVQKYTMDGGLVWTKLYGGPKIEYSRGIAVDDKHVFVTSSTKSYVDGKDNTLVFKIDKESGELINQRLWGGKGIDGATTSIVLGDTDFIYLSGNMTSGDDGEDTGMHTAVVLKVEK